MKSYRIGCVQYRNAQPLVYAMVDADFMRAGGHRLIFDYPARLFTALSKEELDVALLSSIALALLPNTRLASDYCIASVHEVASVGIFSNTPIERIKTLYLDYQSRTSVALAQILLRDYWQCAPALMPAQVGFEHTLRADEGAVIIGDRALQARGNFTHYYDLNSAWQALTSLPFVFAAWIARMPLDDEFTKNFNDFQARNLREKIDEITAAIPCDYYDMHTYYTHNISYLLDEKKRAGLALFLDYVARYGLR